MSPSQAVPTALLRQVVDSSQRGGTPRLPDGDRRQAVVWLTRVLMGDTDWEIHLAELRCIMGLPPTPRLPGHDKQTRFLQRSLDSLHLQFPGRTPLSEDAAFDIEERGLDAATDETLAQLLVNPVALDLLRGLVAAATSEVWARERSRVAQDSAS